MTKTNPNKEKVLENIDMAIYKIPVQPQLETGDPLLNFLSTDTERILTDDYVSDEK